MTDVIRALSVIAGILFLSFVVACIQNGRCDPPGPSATAGGLS